MFISMPSCTTMDPSHNYYDIYKVVVLLYTRVISIYTKWSINDYEQSSYMHSFSIHTTHLLTESPQTGGLSILDDR